MYISKDCPQTIRKRIAVERRIVARIVLDALKLGYAIQVDDGEELHPPATDTKAIFSALGNTDEDYIYLVRPPDTVNTIGWIRLVYGNDGWDVVNDYTVNIENVLENANELAERLDTDLNG